jgi:2-oxoglutarate ferredoxin oxidoreductase subunit beta
VIAYGAPFVAQGSPADLPGLTAMIEEAIRFPGFAFVNVQSPCVTFGAEDQQLKVHKAVMRRLEDLGHDPADRAQAFARAESYGTALLTGVYWRDPDPPPTLGALVRERQQTLMDGAPPRARILDRFVQKREEAP